MGLSNGRAYVTNPDQVFLASYGSPTPILAIDPQAVPIGTPTQGPGTNAIYAGVQSASFAGMGYYISINPSIWKSYAAVPTNQGQRAAVAQRAGPMMGITGSNVRPRNNPSRSQFSEGYTAPIQQFSSVAQGSGAVWSTPSGRGSKADRASQPSMKLVSPFASAPIPTRMPWDL